MAYNNYIHHGNQNRALYGVAVNKSGAQVTCLDCGGRMTKRQGVELGSGDWLHRECLAARRAVRLAREGRGN